MFGIIKIDAHSLVSEKQDVKPKKKRVKRNKLSEDCIFGILYQALRNTKVFRQNICIL